MTATAASFSWSRMPGSREHSTSGLVAQVSTVTKWNSRAQFSTVAGSKESCSWVASQSPRSFPTSRLKFGQQQQHSVTSLLSFSKNDTATIAGGYFCASFSRRRQKHLPTPANQIAVLTCCTRHGAACTHQHHHHTCMHTHQYQSLIANIEI